MQETLLNIMISTRSEQLLKSLFVYELGFKADTKQLRNLDLRSLKPDRNSEFIRERIVNLAKD